MSKCEAKIDGEWGVIEICDAHGRNKDDRMLRLACLARDRAKPDYSDGA